MALSAWQREQIAGRWKRSPPIAETWRAQYREVRLRCASTQQSGRVRTSETGRGADSGGPRPMRQIGPGPRHSTSAPEKHNRLQLHALSARFRWKLRLIKPRACHGRTPRSPPRDTQDTAPENRKEARRQPTQRLPGVRRESTRHGPTSSSPATPAQKHRPTNRPLATPEQRTTSKLRSPAKPPRVDMPRETPNEGSNLSRRSFFEQFVCVCSRRWRRRRPV